MASLDKLSLDLIDCLASHLSVPDLGSLRSTCRMVAGQVSVSPHYVKHFRSKTVQFSVASLQKFNEITHQNGLGCLLQHLTLSCAAEMRVMSADKLTQMRQLLIRAFGNLRRHSAVDSLATLCLVVVPGYANSSGQISGPGQYGTWRCVWDAAARLFSATMAALHESELSVLEELDLFAKLPGALGYHMFTSLSGSFSSFAPFKNLSRLNARFSAPMSARPQKKTHKNDASAEQVCRREYPGNVLTDIFLALTKTMPNLTSMSLNWYQIGQEFVPYLDWGARNPPSNGEDKTKHPATLKGQVENCHLAGFYVSEDDLLAFLKACSPRMFSAHYVQVIDGTWAPILDHLCSPDSTTESYYFDDIVEFWSLLVFQGPGQRKFQFRGPIQGPTILSREGQLAKQPIEYRLPEKGAPTSRKRRAWLKAIEEQFGPVGRERTFIKLKTTPMSPKVADDEEMEEMYLSDAYPEWSEPQRLERGYIGP